MKRGSRVGIQAGIDGGGVLEGKGGADDPVEAVIAEVPGGFGKPACRVPTGALVSGKSRYLAGLDLQSPPVEIRSKGNRTSSLAIERHHHDGRFVPRVQDGVVVRPGCRWPR